MSGSGLQGPAVRQPYPFCFWAWDSLNTARRNTVYVYVKERKSNSASEKEFMCESRRQQVTNKMTERLTGGWGDAFSALSGDPKKAHCAFLSACFRSPKCCAQSGACEVTHALLFHHFPKVQLMPSKCQQQQAMLRSPRFGKTFMSFCWL